MANDSSGENDSGPGDRFVNAFNTSVRADGQDWCVTSMIDGQWRAVSRHATEEMARKAERELNASANRGPHDFQP